MHASLKKNITNKKKDKNCDDNGTSWSDNSFKWIKLNK